jgi:6-phosphogluconolactonase
MRGYIVNYNIKVFDNLDELSEEFARFLQNEVTPAKEKFSLVLSGGSTPKHLFTYLSTNYKIKIKWDKVNLFWGDERCVPPEDEQSNFRLANQSLISNISIPRENIFRIQGENDPVKEENRYSEIIKRNVPMKYNYPVFDLIILGLGEDGHTASLFPDQLHLLTEEKICSVAIHPASGQKRITLTGKAINNARNIIFIVTGKNKKQVVDEIFNNKEAAKQYPASFINPVNGNLYWYLDKHAHD